jgi:hypothetical protein
MKKNYFKYFTLFLMLAISSLIIPSCNQKNHTYSEEDKIRGEYDEYDEPRKAYEFENMRNMDPATRTVLRSKMWEAVIETENLKNTNNYGSSSSNSLAPLSWVERGSSSDAVGPSNGNTRGPGNAAVTSGRMRDLWVDLGDPTGKTVWVGGVSGGLWKTTDVTAATPTWTLVNDYLSNLAVSGICQDPTNPNTMYFCTGEAYFTGGGVGGVGVFKSTDHGVTWNLLPNTSTLVRCTKILCDASGNVYVSTMGISVAVGLQRSTNGGASWVSINPFATAALPTSRIVDFEISSTGAMHVVGGLSSGVGVGGYFYTANPAAASPVWVAPTTPYTIPIGNGARVEIACVGTTVYASLSTADKIDAVARSIDGGANWVTTPLTAANISDLNGGGQGVYSHGLTVDPSNPNTVIVGSLRLLKSTDGGLTFNTISQWVGLAGPYVHADVHNMVWYDNGNKLLIGTDGGLFYSTNKGTNFSDKNTGIRIKQFYGVSIHPTLPNYFLAGSQDNGTHQFNGPGLTSSVEILGGDGGYTAIDQNEPQFQTGTYVYANFRRSSNGGATWSSSGSGSTSGLFINPYDYDNVANKVYAGFSAGQFLRWENPQSGFTFVPVSISQFGTAQVASATVSPYTANRVFFGMTNGKVFQLDNADQATPTVTEITPAGTVAGFVNSVIIGTSDQNITVTLSNAFAATTTSIWSTTNGGTNWTGIDGNLPEMPVYSALYHPDGDTKMYIATEAGVWSTDLINGTSTIWTAETTFPTVKTSMLKYRASDRTVAASTYGRGLWTAIIPNTSCTPAAISVQPVNATICAGSNTNMSITATGTPTLTYQWELSTTGAGGPWTAITANATYSNVTTATLNITGATAAMNTYQYRCVVTGNCAPLIVTSNPAILTINASPAAPTVTPTVTYCQGAISTALTATGTALLWYTTATGGTGSVTAPTPSTAAAGTTTYYVSQTVSTCESPRTAITVTVNTTPVAPIVSTPVNYCQAATATALTATGTNLLWYTTATGGIGSATAPTPLTTAVGSTTYYVSSTIGICEGPRAAVVVNVTATPVAPTVTSPVTYCQGVTASALTATGTNLLWYTTATGGTGSSTAPTPSTTGVGSTTYYVSQTTGCESPRAAIVVNINAAPAAPTATITFYTVCQNQTGILPFSATGTNLLWYTVASGGVGSTTVPTPSTATPGVFFYYVSQTVGGCESPRTSFRFEVVATPPLPTVVSPVNYCQNSTATPLTATGTNTLLLWYTTPTGGSGTFTAPTPSTTTLGTTTYYVSQLSSIGSCEGPRAAITVNVLSVSPAPTVVSPVTYCQNATAVPLTATGTNLLWYTTATGGTGSSTAPTPSTVTAGNTIYYVSQNSSCGESPRTAITVTVNATPTAPTVTSAIAYCQGATATALTATGTNLLWYTTATGGTGTTTAPTPVTSTAGTTNYYVSQTILGCESPRALIAVTVNAIPTAPTVTTPITYCQNATATALTAIGTNLKWYTVAAGGSALATAPTPLTNTIGSITYYVSQTTGTCEGPRAAIVVNITSVTAAPTATTPIAYCQATTATALTATGTNLLWYTTATGGTGTGTAPTPSTTTVGSTTYYVSQTGTCESGRTAIVVNVLATPIAPTATSPIGYCQGSASTVLMATGTNLKWYTVATGGTSSTTAPTPSTTTAGTTTYYVSQTLGTCEGPRTAIVVNVSAAPAITTQPQDITTCTTTATFTVAASGTSLTYQWYSSTDGGLTYNPIATATSSTLLVPGLTAAQANYRYRVVVSSGTCTNAISNAVTARVGTNPIVTLSLSPNGAYNPLTFVGLSAVVTPTGTYTYEWKRNTQVVAGNTTASLTKANGIVDEFGSYQVSATDPVTGCLGISNTLVIADNPNTREKLLIAPNPTRGLLTVTYYSENVNTQNRNIHVYDEKGSRIIVRAFAITGRYGIMNIDLTRYPKGTYVVVLSDANGKQITNAKVIKN